MNSMNYEAKETAPVTEKNHTLQVNNRKEVELTGVKEVDSFDSEEFLLETVLGYLIVRGQNLQLKTLDVAAGKVSIKGRIYELSYVDESEREERAKGFFSKLFR